MSRGDYDLPARDQSVAQRLTVRSAHQCSHFLHAPQMLNKRLCPACRSKGAYSCVADVKDNDLCGNTPIPTAMSCPRVVVADYVVRYAIVMKDWRRSQVGRHCVPAVQEQDTRHR